MARSEATKQSQLLPKQGVKQQRVGLFAPSPRAQHKNPSRACRLSTAIPHVVDVLLKKQSLKNRYYI